MYDLALTPGTDPTIESRRRGYLPDMSKSKTVVSIAVTAPLAVAMLGACQRDDQAADETTTTTTSPTPAAEAVTTELMTPDGRSAANATIEFTNGHATVTLETTTPGVLAPGFHAVHIHQVGQCEANSVPPGGGEPTDFGSAGGHLHEQLQAGHPAAGDLTPLYVRADGSGRMVVTTDSLTLDELRGPQGSALMIHERPDNFANIPSRYTVNGVPGPDAETLATGDAGARLACGVLAPASTPAAPPALTETTTVTEMPPGQPAPPPPAVPGEPATPTVTEPPEPTPTTPTPAPTESSTTTVPDEGTP